VWDAANGAPALHLQTDRLLKATMEARLRDTRQARLESDHICPIDHDRRAARPFAHMRTMPN